MRPQPITGMTCDVDHPYPSPTVGRWIDSMDYGDTRRLIPSMFDRDTLPTWRAIAAYQWSAPCQDEHVAEVAADPILVTHLIASIAIALGVELASNQAPRFGFANAGAGAVFFDLRTGTLSKARQIIDGLQVDARVAAVEQCLTHLDSGFLALKLEASAHFHG